jgi:hypothetical protein
MIEFKAGDRVKVIGQDIVGIVLRAHYDTNEVVIQDDYSEYEAPDDELVYRHDELQLLDSEGDRVMIKDFIWMLPRAVCVVVVVHYFVEGVKLL